MPNHFIMTIHLSTIIFTIMDVHLNKKYNKLIIEIKQNVDVKYPMLVFMSANWFRKLIEAYQIKIFIYRCFKENLFLQYLFMPFAPVFTPTLHPKH